MNDIEVSSIDLVEGGNVFKQGHYLTLGYVPRDEKGETVDLSGKTLNVSLWGRKGVVFEAAATYSGGVIRFTLDKMVPAGDYTVEFTVTSSTDAKYRKKFPTNQHSGRIAIKQSADDLGVVGIQVYTVAQLKAEQKALLDAAVSGFTVDSETKMARVSGTTTHASLPARLEADKQETAAQLEATAEGLNTRLDAKIIESGAANVEVSDARISTTKSKTFNTISQRFEDVEKNTYVPIKNSVKNANFSEGVKDWTITGATSETDSGRITFTTSGSSANLQALQETSDTPRAGDKIYVRLKTKVLNTGLQELFFHLRDWSTGGTFNDFVSLPVTVSSNWVESKRIVTTTSNFVGVARFYLRGTMSTPTSGVKVEMEKPMLINLTKLFGAGKEPSMPDLEALLSVFPDSFFTGTDNLFYAAEVFKKQVNQEKTLATVSTSLQNLQTSTVLNVENKVANADFSEGVNKWGLNGATANVSGDKVVLTSSAATSYMQIMQTVPTAIPKKGDKVYISVTSRNVSSVLSGAHLDFRDWAPGGTYHKFITIPTEQSGVFTRTGGVVEIDVVFVGDPRFYVRVDLTNQTVGQVMELKHFTVINLTEVYGAGKEPSKEEIDKIIDGLPAKFIGKSLNLFNAKQILAKQSEVGNELIRVNSRMKRTNNAVSPRRPMWTITYDDESTTIYDYAFPIHKAEKVPADFYVVPDRVGTGRSFNYGAADVWERLLEMHHTEEKDGRISIQHHNFNHRNTTYFNREQLIENIVSGNEIFFQHGIYPNHFAYPGGSNTQSNRNTLQDFFDSSTLASGALNSYDLNPHAMGRVKFDEISVAACKSYIDQAAATNSWLQTYQHAIHPDGIIGDFVIKTPAEMTELIQYAKLKGVEIVSLDEGMRTFAPFIYHMSETIEPIYSVQRNGIVVVNPTP